MSVSSGGMSADECLRLDECVLEPIRTPGAVQPHGMLFALHPQTFEIISASDNCGRLAGVAASELLGRPLSDVVGLACIAELRSVVAVQSTTSNPVPVLVNGHRYDGIVHETDGLVVVELEATIVAADYQSAPALYGAIRRLGRFALGGGSAGTAQAHPVRPRHGVPLPPRRSR